ncbi:MAG: hypothetical protein ACN6N0_04530 [Microvirgula sp.]
MSVIALKVDIHTRVGLTAGAVALAGLFREQGAGATFYLSLGPDRAGKVPLAEWFAHGGVKPRAHLPFLTRQNGRLWPGPDMGRAVRKCLQALQGDGFELGLKAWDQAAWRKESTDADAEWTRKALERAITGFTRLTGAAPQTLAAPGWHGNWSAVRQSQGLGIHFSSDARGREPFIPVQRAEIVAVPQLPTTLPTLDEVLAESHGDQTQAIERILNLTSTPRRHGHVFSLNAEADGRKLLQMVGLLLSGWQRQGWSCVSLGDLAATLDLSRLPHSELVWETWPGRRGKLARQGDNVFIA